MKLVDDQIGIETKHIIINGNGLYPDLLILKKICETYNGADKFIIFPRTPMKYMRGLSVLRNIHGLLDQGFRNLIFIVDREHITEDAKTEIKNQLIGINILDETPLQDAFLLKCRLGNRNFNLFCSISGLTNCIEEELLKLIKLQWNIQINIQPVSNDAIWRAQLKTELRRLANKKKIKKLLKETGRKKLEMAFPNLCTMFKEIERNYEI